ncbi:hypothetical protein M8J75_016648 [Diaphorina citri]|nr:hypothetical protein M8J75_016648 [Diaphorina citri]
MEEEIASESSCSLFGDEVEEESDFLEDLDETQHATDFSQNESQMSFVTPSSKYLTASSTGRSMKDLEEQLTQLKKENFNLKLRIYFAEERKKILQGAEHTDELVEKIMKLQNSSEVSQVFRFKVPRFKFTVEHQNLKTELSDKEDLIVQTAKAMESLEKGHETRMTELRRMHDAQVRQLQSKIEQLEVDVTYSRFKQEASNARSTNDAAATTVKNLEAQVSNLESKLSDSAQVIGNLESELCTSRATIVTLESRLEDLEGELSSRNTRLGEVYAETRRVEDEKRKAEEEVRSLKSELSQMERNLHSKSDEVVRAKQDVCDKVLCSKRTEEEIKSLRKQLTNQTSRVDELTNTNAQLTAKLNSSNHSGALTSDRIEELTNRNAELSVRLDQCEASLRQERGQVEELSRRLNEERQRTERVRGENEQLRRDNESLKEALSRAPSKCSTSSAPRPPSPSPSLHINISETSDSHHRLNEDYRQLNAKHNALYESFTETCKRLEKTDTEYKKALGVIRNMVKENKKNCHLVETLRDRVREVEERLQCDPAGGAAGDGGRQTHARGQPEGSNEHDLDVYCMTFLDTDLVREEFTEKDIDLLEKQVLIEDYMKQISELSTKLQAYESAAHQTSSTNQKTSSAHTNSAHPNTTTNQNASPAPQDNDPTCLAALQLKSKTEEIERLNTELKKRTFNLQELVNTELWQKNREIEKLLRKSEKKAADLSVLRASLKEKESHLLYLQKEMSEMVAEINATQPGGTLHPDHRRLIDRVKALKDNVDCVSEDKDGLLGQLANLKVSLNMCDKQRREALQAASVLNRRLGELADFLESLISDSTSPDTALPLSGKRKLILRHAVEASRELSRTVGATFNLTECEEERNVPILPDYSEINFLSESDELADVTLEAEEGGRCKDEVIQQLRSQVHNLRDQVKQKDMEIASRTILSGDLSACEAFSEPDLVVSKARMGGVCESNVVSWPSSDSDSSEQDSTRVSKYKADISGPTQNSE